MKAFLGSLKETFSTTDDAVATITVAIQLHGAALAEDHAAAMIVACVPAEEEVIVAKIAAAEATAIPNDVRPATLVLADAISNYAVRALAVGKTIGSWPLADGVFFRNQVLQTNQAITVSSAALPPKPASSQGLQNVPFARASNPSQEAPELPSCTVAAANEGAEEKTLQTDVIKTTTHAGATSICIVITAIDHWAKDVAAIQLAAAVDDGDAILSAYFLSKLGFIDDYIVVLHSPKHHADQLIITQHCVPTHSKNTYSSVIASVPAWSQPS
ncbi:hypothetical protein L7F22_067668 [Adiantum nelumboides]|nr:hypothetical protein [Adiantum nelumboides]